MDRSNSQVALLILAAGASRRMGTPKQLLKIDDQQTLISHTLRVAMESACDPITIVLGANATIIKEAIRPFQKIDIIINKHWSEGMGKSISCGMNYLMKEYPNIEAVVVSVCDQPFLTTAIFNKLIKAYQLRQASIVASNYGARLGVPALFAKAHFQELLNLELDEGARTLIRNREKIESVLFEQGSFDIDTPKEYERYIKKT